MKNLDKLSIEEILEAYDFSPKFLGLYGVACARSVMDLTLDPSQVKEWLDIAEGYWLGKRTKEELGRVRQSAHTYAAVYTSANAPSSAATHAAYYAVSAAYYAANAPAHAAWNAAYYAVHYDVHATYAKGSKRKDVCKDILLDMISNMTRLEKELASKI